MFLIPHEKQTEIIQSPSRFKVIRAGRKGGKTTLEVEIMIFKAACKASDLGLTKTSFPTGRKVLYIAPTQDQARRIIWEALKSRLAGIGKANEQQLTMELSNEDKEKSLIYVSGWENRENHRGYTDVVHITFDETDTLKNFFIAWSEIYRPMFLDTGGTADFIGTPKKENPNLKRLEKEFQGKNASFFKFTSHDNPHLSKEELIALQEEYKGNYEAYKQEILAEHIEDAGALFRYSSLLDMFTNNVPKTNEHYLTVDVADDGTDKTVFALWKGTECYEINLYEGLQTDGIINQIRETASEHRVPYSHVAVDAIGVGAGVASSPLLAGIVGFKSSYGAIKTDDSIVHLPNVHYTKDAPLTSEYKNLRSQCVFKLAQMVNNHEIAVRSEDQRIRSYIIEELSSYQDASKGDGKRMATMKEDIKEMIGRSPDITDTLIMRMYFELLRQLKPLTSEQEAYVDNSIQDILNANMARSQLNSTK